MADTKLKVTFIDIIVTRDGDPLDRGEVYWSFKVDGSVVTSRSVANPLTIGSGGTITLGASSTVTKSGAVGTNIVVSGSVLGEGQRLRRQGRLGLLQPQLYCGEQLGTSNPHPVNLVDNNLNVTLNYIIERSNRDVCEAFSGEPTAGLARGTRAKMPL